VPVGEWQDVKKEIKNVITVVAKTTHYWADHLPVAANGQRQLAAYVGVGQEAVRRVHTQPVVLDGGENNDALVMDPYAALFRRH